MGGRGGEGKGVGGREGIGKGGEGRGKVRVDLRHINCCDAMIQSHLSHIVLTYSSCAGSSR